MVPGELRPAPRRGYHEKGERTVGPKSKFTSGGGLGLQYADASVP